MILAIETWYFEVLVLVLEEADYSLAMLGSLFGFRARCGGRYDYTL
jgi:hypothetical protein